jgi:hypothetical protein
MSMIPPIDTEELFEKLSQAIAEWEDSPYYLKNEELFDLERFLLDHHAHELIVELEKDYGKPLNDKFWSSSLTYQRLKRAREVVKAQDDDQEMKRQEYAQSLEERKIAWQEWLRDLSTSQRRAQFKVIPGGKNKKE